MDSERDIVTETEVHDKQIDRITLKPKILSEKINNLLDGGEEIHILAQDNPQPD